MDTTLRVGSGTGSGQMPRPEDLSGVANCRRWLRRRLDALRLPGPIRADVELVASELITNAFLHAPAPRSVWLRLSPGAPGRVRVTVRDASPCPPLPRFATSTQTHGRGLLVVAALAERWGTCGHAGGKAVWADLRVSTRRARVFTAGDPGRSHSVSGEYRPGTQNASATGQTARVQRTSGPGHRPPLPAPSLARRHTSTSGRSGGVPTRPRWTRPAVTTRGVGRRLRGHVSRRCGSSEAVRTFVMAVVILLGVTALVVAAMTVPGRRRQVTAARWWRALRVLRDSAPPARPPAGLPDLYQAPEHVRVIRPRGRVTDR